MGKREKKKTTLPFVKSLVSIALARKIIPQNIIFLHRNIAILSHLRHILLVPKRSLRNGLVETPAVLYSETAICNRCMKPLIDQNI
jgi:hypothetical protein